MGPASQWAVILTTAVTSTENCGVHLRVPLRDGWSSGELEGLSFSTSHNCREAQHSIRCNQATVTMGLRVLLVDSDLNRFHVSLTSAIFDVAPFTDTDHEVFRGGPSSSRSVFGDYVISVIACRSPYVALLLSHTFSRLLVDNAKKTMGPDCQQADTAVGIWTPQTDPTVAKSPLRSSGLAQGT